MRSRVRSSYVSGNRRRAVGSPGSSGSHRYLAKARGICALEAARVATQNKFQKSWRLQKRLGGRVGLSLRAWACFAIAFPVRNVVD